MNERGANMMIFSHIWTPVMGLFFELQQHIIPQKIRFFMKIYGFENENIV